MIRVLRRGSGTPATGPLERGGRRPLRAILALVVVSLTTLPLAACATVPDSGPVREGLESLDQGERGVLFNPSGPIPGADQETIVRGFVRAASSSEGDYEIARQFLAPTYADQWDPWSGVIVDEGAPQFQSPKEGVAVLSLRVVATVDGAGSMTPAEPGSHDDVQFELAEVGGEWRIVSAPNGIILDRNTFMAVWAARPVYLLSADRRLVPDTRWFLNRPTMSTQIVRELIAGPSASMAGALHTAFPKGTVLMSGSVPIVDGTAVIDLSPELFDADEVTMDLLKRQVAASLQSVPDVSRFQLAVHGTVVDGGPVAASEDLTSGIQNATVMKEGVFGVVSGGEVKEIEGLGERVAELGPVAATVAPDRSAVAVLHDEGVSWVGENETIGIDERRGLLTPSLDVLGYVWTYSSSAPGEISATMPGGHVAQLAAPWLEGRRVVAVRVSMGGNRVAALVARGGESEVLVAGIIRDEGGVPIGLTETAPVQLWDPGAPIDLDWIGDTRFATLTETGLLGGSGKVMIGEVGRFPVESGAVAGGSSISGGGSRALLRVLDDQHRMFAPQGAGWQQQLTDVELLAKVG